MRRLQSVLAAVAVVIMIVALQPQKAEAAGLSRKAYNMVKGRWWYQSSSGGYDARFTRKKIIYYNRKNYEVERTAAIKKCIKKKDGYHVLVKDGKVRYYYIFPFEGTGKKDYQLWFRFKSDGEYHYSGSSSLNPGKWGSW